jgi:hypothetical protein
MNEEEQKILDKIHKTGYPLEVDVLDWLLQEGWSVFPEYIYLDKKEKKIRTIDIVAHLFLKEAKLWELPILIVECKTSDRDKPWIFYSTKGSLKTFLEKFPKEGLNLLYLSSFSTIALHLVQRFINWEEPTQEESLSALSKISGLYQNVHLFDVNLSRAYSCHVLRKSMKKGEPDDFQRALYQIRGAFLRISEVHPKTPVFPIIVLKGNMYEYIKTGENEELKPSNHILYSSLFLQEPDFEPTRHSFPPTIIEVVKDTYFSQYLKLLKKDLEYLASLYKTLDMRSGS